MAAGQGRGPPSRGVHNEASTSQPALTGSNQTSNEPAVRQFKEKLYHRQYRKNSVI